MNAGGPGRWLSTARNAWIIAAVAALALFTASIPGYLSGFVFTAQVEAPDEFVSMIRWTSVIASLVSVVVSLILATILFLRKSEDRMAMFVSFYLLGYGVVLAGPLEALENWLHRVGSYSVLAQTILFTTPTLALFYLFPSGRFVPHWTRWLTLLSLLLIPTVAFYSTPDEWRTLSTPTTWGVGFVLVLLILMGVYAQFYRFRHVSNPAERQQTKMVILGLLLWMALVELQTPQYIYLQRVPSGTPQPWWGPLGAAVWWLSLAVLPLSLSVAVLRYRLFEIDIIIRRTLVYGALTLLLALVYFGSVAALQQLLRLITGQASEIAIIVSTLAIAALFNPLRRRIQQIIDSRFYRRKFDAQKVLSEFATMARDEVELTRLTSELLKVVDETMQPAHVSLWLRRAGDNRGQTSERK